MTTNKASRYKYYVSVKSKLQHLPLGIPRAFDVFSCPGRGNLINDFMLRVALIPRGAISHAEDKPSCIQSERYPIRGGLAEKQRLAQALFCI